MSTKYGFDNDLKEELLDWLLNPVKPQGQQTQSQWGAAHGVLQQTVSAWTREPKFRKVWERELAKQNLDPDLTQKVLAGIQKAAADGDVAAAKLWMTHISQFQVEADETEVSSLSDDELDDLILELATAERERRDALA